jgi:hypothetical protein
VNATIFDLSAEKSLLGAMIADAEAVGPVFSLLPPDAWWNPRHRQLAIVLREMFVRGDPVDMTTTKSAVAARRVSGVDDDFVEDVYVGGFYNPGHAQAYADRLLDVHAQRELVRTLDEELRGVQETLDAGYSIDVPALASKLRKAVDVAESSARPEAFTPRSVMDVLAGQDTYDWLVPGLMERMDRLVLTGQEGGGKSVLLTQLATSFVGGMHPFTTAVLGEGDRGCRVAVVDCELTERQARGRYRRLVRNVDDARRANGHDPVNWRENLFVEFRPEGIDITSGPDRQWLERYVAATAPDVLVIGPLYRLTTRDESDPGAVREIQHAIDSIRVRHNAAVITEAHSGHATDVSGERKVRPSGSSLWLRWPEFGYGLRRASANDSEVAAFLANVDDRIRQINRGRPVVVDVVPWRGSREERAWPDRLRYGRTLPWEPFDPAYYAESEIIREF